MLAAGVDALSLPGGRVVISVERFLNLRTGSGNDVIATSLDPELVDVVDTGGGNDTVTVFGGQTSGATGHDRVELGAGTDLLIIDYTAATDQLLMTTPVASGGGQSGQVRLGGGVRVTYGGVDRLNVSAGSGADDLRGGSGADILNGGAGTDTLNGGLGADTLTGGAGADLFLITAGGSPAAAPDVLRDFASGEDRLDLTALGLTATSVVIVHQSANGSVVLVDADGNGGYETVVLAATSVTTSDLAGLAGGIIVVGAPATRPSTAPR